MLGALKVMSREEWFQVSPCLLWLYIMDAVTCVSVGVHARN